MTARESDSRRKGLPRSGLWAPVLAELAFWLFGPALFLAAYVAHFGRPATAVLPHLSLVLTVWLVTVALRGLVWRTEQQGTWHTLPLSIGLGSLVFVGVLYYGLVLIGLALWNDVVSWGMIRAYAPHLGPLTQAVGVRPGPLLGLLLLAQICLWAAAWQHTTRWDRTRDLALRVRPGAGSAALALIVLLCGVQVTGIWGGNWALRQEPVSLTIAPGFHPFQNHAMDQGLRLRNIEADRAARARYQPTSSAHARNVVLILVDGLRPDHLSLLGYHRPTTPILSSLAREHGLRQPGPTFSGCSESVCGLMGILASNYIHGLSSRPITLHEILARHGFRVHGILSGDHENFYGLRRLYGPMDSYTDGFHAGAAHLNDDRLVLEALDALPDWDGTPVFFHLHLNVCSHPDPSDRRAAIRAGGALQPRTGRCPARRGSGRKGSRRELLR